MAWPSLCFRKMRPKEGGYMPVNQEDELAAPCGLYGPAARDSRSRWLAKDDAAPFLTVRGRARSWTFLVGRIKVLTPGL